MKKENGRRCTEMKREKRQRRTGQTERRRKQKGGEAVTGDNGKRDEHQENKNKNRYALRIFFRILLIFTGAGFLWDPFFLYSFSTLALPPAPLRKEKKSKGSNSEKKKTK